MKKKLIITILIVFFLFLFLFLNYKNKKNGNNINNQIDIAENFLNNTNSYKAEIDVNINSNKNSINYKIIQEEKGDYSKEEIIEGQNIEGLQLEIKDNVLKVFNTKLNLEKIFENYSTFSNNSLFLSTFIKEFKDPNNKTKIDYTEENIVLKLEINENKYIKYKELVLNSKTQKPIKMIISNSYKKQTTSIIYTNIEF